MQAHDNDQCPKEGDSDGRRDAEPGAVQDAPGVADQEAAYTDNRTVRVVNMSATLRGSGRLN